MISKVQSHLSAGRAGKAADWQHNPALHRGLLQAPGPLQAGTRPVTDQPAQVFALRPARHSETAEAVEGGRGPGADGVGVWEPLEPGITNDQYTFPLAYVINMYKN